MAVPQPVALSITCKPRMVYCMLKFVWGHHL